MAKRHPFKKAKPGEPIPVTVRQLESFMLEHNGRFNSRDYDKFERIKLMESLIRDAIHELKTYSLETLAQHFDVRLLGVVSAFLRGWTPKTTNGTTFPSHIFHAR